MTRAAEDVNRRLLRARDLMDRDYACPLDVDALAGVALMARSHFIREFKRVFGETPYRYLQRRRIERAMFLLRHTTATVTDICHQVGFTSLGTFSRTFTAVVQVTPTDYRDRSPSLGHAAPTAFAMRWVRPTGAATRSGQRSGPVGAEPRGERRVEQAGPAGVAIGHRVRAVAGP